MFESFYFTVKVLSSNTNKHPLQDKLIFYTVVFFVNSL